MKKLKSIAIACMILLLCTVVGSFVSFGVVSPQETEETVTYDYYVVAGYDTVPSEPEPATMPPGFNIAGDPLVYDFGDITKVEGKTWLYEGVVGTPTDSAYAKMNITNLLGYDITIANLTAEITAGTPTKRFFFTPAGMWFGDYTIIVIDTLDPWDPSYPLDECNYTTGAVTVRMDGPDWWTKAAGTPYPEGWQTGPGSLLEPDHGGDAEATGHVAPVQLANGATLTEYFGIVLFGDADAGTQINGKITLSLTYKYTIPGSPIARFTSTAGNVTVGEMVTFNASDSMPNGGNILSYAWDFGDGAIGTGKTATHKYTTAGNYTVKLNITDSQGLWDTRSESITVGAAPAEFPWLWVAVGVLVVFVVVASVVFAVRRRKQEQ